MKTIIQPYTLEQLVRDIKQDLLVEVIVDMKKTELSLDQARQLAKDFLGILPPVNKEELIQKLGSLGKLYKEVRTIFIKYAKLFDEEKRTYLREQAHRFLEKRNISYALLAVKGGIIYE